jgi:hypothetical protein
MIHFKNEPLHAIHCPYHAGSWTLRHNDIRDLLCKLFRKAYPDSPLQLEALVGKTNPAQHGTVWEMFSDITLAMGTETLLIDVAVVSPGGSAYLQYLTLSSINQEGASKHKEQSKRWHYGRIAAPHTPVPNSVVHVSDQRNGRRQRVLKYGGGAGEISYSFVLSSNLLDASDPPLSVFSSVYPYPNFPQNLFLE